MRKRPEVPTTAIIAFAAAVSFIAILAVVALAAGSIGGLGGQPAQASHQGGTVTLAALDMDPTGNTVATTPSGNVEETALGTINTCVEVTHPATFDVDFVVQGYPAATDSLVAYSAEIGFPTGLRLTNSITGDIPILGRTLISGDPQSGPFFPVLDPTTGPVYGGGTDIDGPGTFAVTVADFSDLDADESIDGEENSDGFLVRYTFDTTAAGPALLNLTLSPATTASVVQDDDGDMTVTTTQGGTVAVGTACATPPDAVNDSGAVATVNEDSGANAIDVLANDTDGGSPPLTITAVTQGSNGSVAITGGSTGLTYTPDANFFGSDSFTYTIQNAALGSDTATVNVTVNNVPDAPVAGGVDMGSVQENSGADLPNGWIPSVSDADPGDALTCSIVTQPTDGTATVETDCSSGTYTPDVGFLGSDSFTYKVVDDGEASDTAAVTVNVGAAPPSPTVTVGTPTATPVASPASAGPTPTPTILPGTGSPVSAGGGGGSGLVFLIAGLVALVVAPGAVAVGITLRRKANLSR